MSSPIETQVSDAAPDSDAVTGNIVKTYFRYLLPSLVGIIAMSSASIVDGMFIGNLVGFEALAAVNLIIPILTIVGGVAFMIAIGGSVRAGKYLGERNVPAASAIFSKVLVAVTVFSALIIALSLLFENALFRMLGADEQLFPLMSSYYRIILPFLLAQMLSVVLYFHVRLDNAPNLAAVALVIGSVLNIVLDYVFIAVFDFGLQGAAWATGLTQLLTLVILLTYFMNKDHKLRFSLVQHDWREVFQAAYNGLSEFINNIAGGIIGLLFNWMLIHRIGVEGVAAMTVVNYLMMLGFMVFFSIADTGQVMFSQNFGARNVTRLKAFLALAGLLAAFISLVTILVLLLFNEPLIYLFLDSEGSESAFTLAQQFVYYVWPLFIFAGINMLISAYLTGLHLAFQSGVISLCRGLILPAILLLVAYQLFDDGRFVAALAIAEALTFVIAAIYFIQHRPSRELAD